MTASAGAPIDDAIKWEQVDWDLARREVRRLQMRIAKAVKEGLWRKVQGLAIPALALVLRQAVGCEAGDLESGEENPGR